MGTVDNIYGNLRIDSGKFCDRLVKFPSAVAPQVSDSQLQLPILSQPLCFPDQLICLVENRLAVRVEVLSGSRNGESAVFPMNQLDPQLPLQRLNLLRDSGLGNITLLRRLGKAAAFNNSHKIFHLSEKHTSNLPARHCFCFVFWILFYL